MDISISGQRLNFLVAVCAILISGASFYATYLQANSAEQQVKAMTWPLIEFTHGNYNVETREQNLTLTLKNAGVGPAIIKTVEFNYLDKQHATLNDFLKTCCGDEYGAYVSLVQKDPTDAANWTFTTSPVAGIILPVGGEVNFLSLLQHENNSPLWHKINSERWKLDLEICYCSLLENCYVTDKPGQVDEVATCSATSGR